MAELIARIAISYLVVTGIGVLLSRSFYEPMVTGNANADPINICFRG